MTLALAYVAIDATDLDAWEHFATGTLGFEVRRDGDTLLARLDQRRQRVIVSRGDRDGLAAYGLECRSAGALVELRDRLRAAGVEARDGDAATLAARDVRRLVHLSDPAGVAVELVAGHGSTVAPLESPTGARFVSDDDVGMGHVVLGVADLDAALGFYVDLLGFAISDTMTLGGAPLAFLHSNQRHHTVALMGVGADVGLHHFMVEVDSIDAVGRAYDQVRAERRPLEFTLGRHSNDEMLSFYVRTPSGFSVEYGTGGLRVTPGSWTATHLDAPSLWGHTPEEPAP